jgi:putative ABC transport system substrate-binding protein
MIGRREFITLLGAGAAWPVAARAQQRPVSPVVGFLNEGRPDFAGEQLPAFHRGLSDTGYVEGRNVAVEYRWADEHLERLPGLAGDLIRREVAVIVALTTPSSLAAKAATNTIPVVFSTGNDPVAIGLVNSLNRPGGNVTGITNLNTLVAGKRLQMLREMLPAASSMGFLVNPANVVYAATETREIQAAARTLGVHLVVLSASDSDAFEATFMTMVREGVAGLVVGGDLLFLNHDKELVALAARFGIPTMFRVFESVAAGGLMSYATDYLDAVRQAGVYAGRILKGEKPADLPVQQVTKMLLTINLKTAKALALDVPAGLLVRADEVIE